MMYCEELEPARCNEFAATPPASALAADTEAAGATLADCPTCVSWFDGCNTCFVSDGQIGGCTYMMCDTMEPERCLMYAPDANDQDRRERQVVGVHAPRVVAHLP